MKQIIRLLAMLLWATAALAQIDITSPWRGPFGDLGRGLTWGASGTGGMNNAFIINLPIPQTGACLFIQNLDGANAHAFLLNAYISGDQRALGYYTSPNAGWTQVNVTSRYLGYNQPYTIPASDLGVFSISPMGASRVAFVISNSVAPGIANIYYSFGSASPCAANIPPNAQMFVDARTVTTPGANDISWIGWPAASAYQGAPQTWRACSFYLYANPTVVGTLNTYIHAWDSFTGNQDDRVSFLQVAAASRQSAEVSFEPNANPHAIATRALAAGTVQTGIPSDILMLSYVVAGAGASYAVKLVGICH